MCLLARFSKANDFKGLDCAHTIFMRLNNTTRPQLLMTRLTEHKTATPRSVEAISR